MKKKILLTFLVCISAFSISSCSKKKKVFILEGSKMYNNQNYTISKGQTIYFTYNWYIDADNYDEWRNNCSDYDKLIKSQLVGTNLDNLIFTELDTGIFYMSCDKEFIEDVHIEYLETVFKDYVCRLPMNITISYVQNEETAAFPSSYRENGEGLNSHNLEALWTSKSGATYKSCEKNVAYFTICTDKYENLKNAYFVINNVSIVNNEKVRIKNLSAKNLHGEDIEEMVELCPDYDKIEEFNYNTLSNYISLSYDQIDYNLKSLPFIWEREDTDYSSYTNGFRKMIIRFEFEDDYEDESSLTGIMLKFDVSISGEPYTFYREMTYSKDYSKDDLLSCFENI